MSRELNSLRQQRHGRASLRRGPQWFDEAMKQEYVQYFSEQRRTIRDQRLRANARCISWLLTVPVIAFHDVILRVIGL